MKLISKNLVYIVLKTSWNIKKTKAHDLVIKIDISSLKNNLLFIIFLNFQLIIDISQIQLDKRLGLT